MLQPDGAVRQHQHRLAFDLGVAVRHRDRGFLMGAGVPFEVRVVDQRFMQAAEAGARIGGRVMSSTGCVRIALQAQFEKAAALLAKSSFEDKADLLLLTARISSTFEERENHYRELTEGPYQKYPEAWLERGVNAFKAGQFSLAEKSLRQVQDSRALYLLGQILLKQGKRFEAEQQFLKLTQDYPISSLVGESLLFAAKASDGEKAKAYCRKVFEEYPESSAAAETYFIFYPYRDYVQGERAAIKHLQGMQKRFPDSPYLVIAHYLIGMDERRDRKNAQGKWIRKKDLIAAIDAFQEAESLFERLKIPSDQSDFFTRVRFRCTFERALANLNIAEESQGPKREIFTQYATEVFEQLYRDLKDEESAFWLAQAYLKGQQEEAAEKLLKSMSTEQSGYYPSRVHYELGKIAMGRNDYTQALRYFSQSENKSQNSISADQKIDLWIQQSHCYRELHNFDEAMLILSKAINDDTISSLRVKAMYLRGEIYALQGRHDLARKQWEATAKKGGEWAQKSKLRLP